MSIPVTCPNGHKHKVKDRFAGKIGLCPDCRAPIRVPRRTSEEVIMDILQPNESGLLGVGLDVPEPDEDDEDFGDIRFRRARHKLCRKCRGKMPADACVCPNCRAYARRTGPAVSHQVAAFALATAPAVAR